MSLVLLQDKKGDQKIRKFFKSTKLINPKKNIQIANFTHEEE